MASEGIVLSKNGFQALAELEDEDKAPEVHVGQEANESKEPSLETNMINKEASLETNMVKENYNPIISADHGDSDKHTSSGTSSSSLMPSLSGRKGGKSKMPIAKGYNLRNKTTNTNGGCG